MSDQKKRGYKSFYKGKGIKGEGNISFEGAPNTNIDVYRKKDGQFIQRRKIGQNGYALKDYDMADAHKPFDHVHDISPITGRNAQHRSPNKQEKREIQKAKNKRRLL